MENSILFHTECPELSRNAFLLSSFSTAQLIRRNKTSEPSQDTKRVTVTLGRQERHGTTCLQTSNTFLHNGPGCRSGKRGSSTPGMPVACQREQPVSLAESLSATSRKIRSGVAERASRESKNTRLPFQNPNLTTFFGAVPFCKACPSVYRCLCYPSSLGPINPFVLPLNKSSVNVAMTFKV